MANVISRCTHMNLALEATEMAPHHPVSQGKLTDLPQKQKDLIKKLYNSEDVLLYSLPVGNICVPTLSEEETDGDVFTHVMYGKVCNIFNYAFL